MIKLSFFGLIAFASAISIGCGGGNGFPPPSPVTGTVTYQGKPVEGASVSFLTSDSAGRAASGTTDASGVYKLTTFAPDDGALPGSYTVTIAKSTSSIPDSEVDVTAPGEGYEEMMAAAGSNTLSKLNKDELPTKYSNPAESDLKASVEADKPNQFDFELTN